MIIRTSLLLGSAVLLGLCACGKKSAPDGANPVPSSGTAATPAPLQAAMALLSGFEGEIDLSMTDTEKNPPSSTAMAVLVKSGKVRFDMPEKLGGRTPLGAGAYVILDAAAKKLEIVSDAQKQVFVVDFNTSAESLKGLAGPHRGGPQAPEAPKATITKTGKLETVAGRKCEDWEVAKDHRESTVCVAEEEASWFHIPLTGFPAEHAWAAELLDGKHFPLRLINYDKDGTTEKGRFEVTKIDKRSLPAASFEYPATYAVSDFAQMFARMGAYPGGMPSGGRPGMPEGMRGFPNGMPMGPRPHHP